MLDLERVLKAQAVEIGAQSVDLLGIADAGQFRRGVIDAEGGEDLVRIINEVTKSTT